MANAHVSPDFAPDRDQIASDSSSRCRQSLLTSLWVLVALYALDAYSSTSDLTVGGRRIADYIDSCGDYGDHRVHVAADTQLPKN
jgi:hypothetical protein